MVKWYVSRLTLIDRPDQQPFGPRHGIHIVTAAGLVLALHVLARRCCACNSDYRRDVVTVQRAPLK